MSEFKSYAQSGQDRFCYEVLGRKTDGTFLDVGAGHVTEKSNNYGLEQIGWRGLCIDLNPQGDTSQRSSPFIRGDALNLDWENTLCAFSIGRADGPSTRNMLWPEIDYLSLDVDGATLDALRTLPLSELKFKVITCEHDSYRFGDDPRIAMRNILKSYGYDLVCADVHDQGLAYEDWWVAPSLSDSAKRFRCSGKDWKDIFK